VSVDDDGRSLQEADPAPRSSRSRWLWLWAVCCLVVLGLTFLLGTVVRSPWQEAVENSGKEPIVTAEVEVRSLAEERVEIQGTVSQGVESDVTVSSAEGATPVVSATYKTVGEILAPGQALAEVSGQPLIALALPFELYRDLVPGMSGTDVRVVQQALADLGLFSGSIDGEYGAATASSVALLYSQAAVAAPSASDEAVSAVDAAQEMLDEAKIVEEDATLAVTSTASGVTASEQAGDATALAEARTALTQAQRQQSRALTSRITAT
jgi:peptidoglycan hydrolase-like protein with peptidoglycan-binding domain